MVTLDLSRLDDRTLMDVQDYVKPLSRPWRELALLAECCDVPIASLADLPLGTRDRLLLEMRVHLFGRRAEAESRCVSCGARLDLTFDVAAMLGSDRDRQSQHEVVYGSRRLRLRAPTSADLAETMAGRSAAASAATPDAEDQLLARCVEADDADMRTLLRDPELRSRIVETLAQLDPQAEITLAIGCPHCGAAGELAFDPAGFLLAEIEAYTDRLIDEVDQLARVYGWSEADILALGAHRRRRYLEVTS